MSGIYLSRGILLLANSLNPFLSKPFFSSAFSSAVMGVVPFPHSLRDREHVSRSHEQNETKQKTINVQ